MPLTEKAAHLVKVFGYLTDKEASFLQEVIVDLPENSTCVNIGAGTGTSAMAVLEKRPDLTDTFYTIDIRDYGNPYGGLVNERTAFSNAKMDFPQQIHGDSKEIAKKWDKGNLDLLIIDGDHSREGVRGDISLWEQHLKEGAVVFLHDYHRAEWPEVAVAVQDFMFNRPEKYELVGQVETYIAFTYKG